MPLVSVVEDGELQHRQTKRRASASDFEADFCRRKKIDTLFSW